jgi:hypothetical protein
MFARMAGIAVVQPSLSIRPPEEGIGVKGIGGR